jgi:hypothetical protein
MGTYLIWFDDDRKKTADVKIHEAISAYERKFARHPNVVLINEAEQIETTSDVRLRPLSFIRPSNYYVGFEDAA